MWMKSPRDRHSLSAAENGSISRSFRVLRSTGRNDEDCYTFEHFARSTLILRSTYYYHYKRSSLGLKEEAKWS